MEKCATIDASGAKLPSTLFLRAPFVRQSLSGVEGIAGGEQKNGILREIHSENASVFSAMPGSTGDTCSGVNPLRPVGKFLTLPT